MKRIILWAALLLLAIQLVPVDRTNPPVQKADNFVDVIAPPTEIQFMLKGACYDCHSNETKYPVYAYIAPISWSLKSHVNDGRRHLNFSEWGNYNKDLKKDMLSHAITEVEDGGMPLPAYILYHPAANLNKAQRGQLAAYFKGLLDGGKY